VTRAPVAPPLDPGLGSLPLEERRRRLEVLNEAVRGCTRCALHETRTQTVFARGTGSSGLCFVGEGPGADEDAQGYPFVGAAGQLLDRMIGAMGFSRDEVYVCNIVKCRPPNNRKPEPAEMATCMPYLQEQLELLQPSVIVALGATAVQGLLGTTEGIMRLRGKWKLYRGRIAVMPTFHPAYLLRTPNAKREVWEDLQAVVRQMGRTLPARS
jgi:DNA polymerase